MQYVNPTKTHPVFKCDHLPNIAMYSWGHYEAVFTQVSRRN